MTPFRIIPLLWLVFVSSGSFSQHLQREINEQVWKVQLQAMNTNEAERFMSVMSDDVVQVSYSRNTIRDKARFRDQVITAYNRMLERKTKRTMEFRFLNRIANDSAGFEDGFFEYGLINDKGEKQVFYGYFQVVLRKENGLWKVLVDYDSETYQGAPVSKQLFESARLMEAAAN
jgi:ketosteroid isomerase-like protein